MANVKTENQTSFCISLISIILISPGAYILQGPFFCGLFLEGLMFGGAYERREICVSKSIGLACSGKEITIFALLYFVFEGKFQVQAPRGAYILRGGLVEGFFALRFWGAYIWRGLYNGRACFRNFTV